jgi:coenzyme F420 hydrogenase subunit beta
MTDKTIAYVVKDGLCTGCGTCIALCPNEAIKLTINEKKGIYVPELNEGKCNNCGICYEVCPGHGVNFKELNLEIFGKEPEDVLIGNYLNCYVGHSTEYDIRYNSSSGGLVTQLLIFALEEGIIDGALVTRMKKNNPLEPEPFIARTKEEIIEASKSKYCPVPVNIALKKILEAEDEERFAIVGLPCHIHGIRKAEQVNKKLKEKIVLHLGLFCCSYGANFLATEYALQRMNVQKESVTRIDYREGDFPPGTMSIKVKNGDIIKISHAEFWHIIFTPFVTWFAPIRCMLCIDQTCELADISIGSEWFPYLTHDNINQSLILLRNKFIENFLQNCKHQKKIELIKIEKEDLSKGVNNYKKKQLKARMSFFKLFRKTIPTYDMMGVQDTTFKAYLGIISLYMPAYLSSKRYLWSLILIYQLLLQKASDIFRKFKEIYQFFN